MLNEKRDQKVKRQKYFQQLSKIIHRKLFPIKWLAKNFITASVQTLTHPAPGKIY